MSKKGTSQIEYPRFVIDSLGNKIIEMTIEQAQKLDNNSEVLILYQKLNSQSQKSDSVCIKVIGQKDEVISSQKVLISNLNRSLTTKEEEIKILQEEIRNHESIEKNLTSQVENREGVIKEKDKQIRKMKLKMILGGAAGAAVISGLLFIVLLAP